MKLALLKQHCMKGYHALQAHNTSRHRQLSEAIVGIRHGRLDAVSGSS